MNIVTHGTEQLVVARPEAIPFGQGLRLGAPARPRFDSIDLMRGIVIVLMALDHVKGNFLHPPFEPFEPLDLLQTSPALFITRWVTHFCAPVFVFLAGTGAFLYGTRGRTKGQISWFLFSRGLWLIVLEFTVIRFSWFLNLSYDREGFYAFGQVIWAIGCSMILLSVLVFLPISVVTLFGVSLILFHNLTDAVRPESWGAYDWLWKVLHTGQTIHPFRDLQGDSFERLRAVGFWPFYPLIPWLGVLAAGYGFGAMMLLEPKRRRREIIGLGIGITLLFLALRYSNVYGDRPESVAGRPGPWSVQHGHGSAFVDAVFTVFSFVSCQKYPPSLCFLLMTLGPAMILIGLCDRERPLGVVGRFFITYGRVPLFFYLLHWYLIKGLLLLMEYLRFGRVDWLYGNPDPTLNPQPENHRYDLWVIYVVWWGVVLALFPLCYWFAGVKRRSKAAWLSYL